MDLNVGALNEYQNSLVKVYSTNTDDHVSKLPEDILSFILSLLTMRDAIKTRVLSTRWRYLFTSTANLHFDPFTMFGINYGFDSWKGKYLTENSDDLWEGKFRFVTAVDQFLRLCRSPKIDSLKVCYCLGNESSPYVDRWISFVVRMKVEKIDINFSYVPRGCELYKVPCHLLPQDKASQIKQLCLQSCILRPSPDLSNCFNSLISLDLNEVPLDQGAFDNILSGCINLERLNLKDCSLPLSLFICGRLLFLKFILLNDCYGAKKIEVSTTAALTLFEYIGLMTNLTFVGNIYIEKVHLRFLNPFLAGTNYMFGGLAKELPQLQVLSLVFCTRQLRPIPANMTKFSQLKELELIVFVSTDFDLLSFASILNASPCVQKFHLSLNDGTYRGPMVKSDPCKQLYYGLKEVEISGFRERSNSLELAIYLLNSGIVLERMIINSRKRFSCGYSSWIMDREPMKECQRKRVYELLSKEKPDVELTVV